jgi:hypothetical protein
MNHTNLGLIAIFAAATLVIRTISAVAPTPAFAGGYLMIVEGYLKIRRTNVNLNYSL